MDLTDFSLVDLLDMYADAVGDLEYGFDFDTNQRKIAARDEVARRIYGDVLTDDEDFDPDNQ